MIKNFWLCIAILAFNIYILSSLFCQNADAKEIILVYSGETHAMLYPCNCPKEPDGGIARRAALVKELRKKYPQMLLLDSGGFFAGGLLDEYTLNTKLDSERSLVNLKALEMMKFDAVAIGDDEFNFGEKFLQDNIAKSKLTFVSCNLKAKRILPYIIKDVSGAKIGIIGVTNPLSAQKAETIKVNDVKPALAEAIAQVKKSGADLVVVLSHLGENEDFNLIKSIKGIDILITGHALGKEEPFAKIDNTIILRPTWQGRRLGKAVFEVKDNKVTGFKVEALRLSDKISDDKDILKILPRCFSDTDCRKEGLAGTCLEAGTLNSSCRFNQPQKVDLLIITPKRCLTCDEQTVIKFLKRYFPGLNVSYLYYPSRRAEELIKDFAISGLPAYLLGKEVAKEKNFNSLKENLEVKGDYYMVKPQLSGVSVFLNRKKIKGRLDLFISLYDKFTPELLEVIREFSPQIHFLATEKDGQFDASKGNLEVEEYLRGVCVRKYFPKEFFDYISCRAKNINSSWWENCLGDLDSNKIRSCAKGNEGKELLKENIELNKQMQVLFGPAYLVENEEIFATQGAPTKKELQKIIKR